MVENESKPKKMGSRGNKKRWWDLFISLWLFLCGGITRASANLHGSRQITGYTFICCFHHRNHNDVVHGILAIYTQIHAHRVPPHKYRIYEMQIMEEINTGTI